MITLGTIAAAGIILGAASAGISAVAGIYNIAIARRNLRKTEEIEAGVKHALHALKLSTAKRRK